MAANIQRCPNDENRKNLLPWEQESPGKMYKVFLQTMPDDDSTILWYAIEKIIRKRLPHFCHVFIDHPATPAAVISVYLIGGLSGRI